MYKGASMNYPELYRKRIIPNECVKLKDDLILSYENNMLVTKWKALKPRMDLHHGYSYYFFEEGYKVSKFYKEDGTLLYYYCDIIDYERKVEENSIVVTDLLADVIIYPDNTVKVVDLDELATALDEKILNISQLKKSLRCLSKLLDLIYKGNFHTIAEIFEQYEAH